MLALAVALREVFPAAWTAQGVLARSEVMQEVLMRTVPLQELLARVLVVQEVFAHAMDWWDVFPTAVATRETIASANQGTRGVHTRHQGPCTLLSPQFRRTATHVASATRQATSMT